MTNPTLSLEAVAGLQHLADIINGYLPPHRSIVELVQDMGGIDTEDPAETVPLELTSRDLILLRLAIDIALMGRALEASQPEQP